MGLTMQVTIDGDSIRKMLPELIEDVKRIERENIDLLSFKQSVPYDAIDLLVHGMERDHDATWHQVHDWLMGARNQGDIQP